MKKMLTGSCPAVTAVAVILLFVCRFHFVPADDPVKSGTVNAAFDKPRKEAIKYDSVFYREDGYSILNKLPEYPVKTFVIRTVKGKRDIFSPEDSGEKNTAGTADVKFITPEKAALVESYIMRSDFSDTIVTNNIIAIENLGVLQAMLNNIPDDGKGGLHPDNNREYGGIVNQDYTIDTIIGEQGILCDSILRTVRLPDRGIAEYHSHPSGCIGDIPDNNCPYRKFSDSTCFYTQGPSKVDQDNVGNRTGYVFGMRSGLIYIYNKKEGVVATLPLQVVKIKKAATWVR